MVEKQKILHIVEAMGGGVFSYIVELANGLSEEFDITIAFGIRNETPDNYSEYFNDSIQLIHVKNFNRSINISKDFKAYFELRKIVKEMKPDIIHMHSSKAGVIGRAMFNDKKYKMFYTPHGYSFLMENISQIKKNIYKLIEKACGKKDCMTIACGYGEWEESKKVTRKTTYISNGINTDKMDRVLALKDRTDSNDRFTVYTVGRISYQKNPEMFNQIAELLPQIQFLWIGEGDLRDELKASNIKITGWLEGDKAMRLAKQGDVFILPSRWEGLPISLLEAMYMKKMCIVSNVIGNRDVIQNGVSGFVCNTAEEFAEAIKKAEKQMNYEMAENAYNQIMNCYNTESFCEKYKALYLA